MQVSQAAAAIELQIRRRPSAKSQGSGNIGFNILKSNSHAQQNSLIAREASTLTAPLVAAYGHK